MKTDAVDEKLLKELSLDCRQSNSQLARKLRTSKQVIKYRIDRLEKNGILIGFQAPLNLTKLGLNAFIIIFAKIEHANTEKRNEIIEYLVKHKKVGAVVKQGGEHDLFIAIAEKTNYEAFKLIDDIFKPYSEHLHTYDVLVRVASAAYRTGKKIPQVAIAKQEKIDELDKRILRNIANNARAPLVLLAEKIKVPPSTISARLRLLKQKGIIQAYSARISATKLGFLGHRIMIVLKGLNDATIRKVESFCEKEHSIIGASFGFGKWNAEIRLDVRNAEELQKVIIRMQEEFSEDIRSFTTANVFQTLKEDFSVAVECID